VVALVALAVHVRLVPVLLAQVAQVALVRLVPVLLAQVAQADRVQVSLAVHVQASVAAQVLAPVAHQAASLVQRVAVQLVVAAETPQAPLAHSVRVAHAVRARLERASVQSAKSLSREATHQALVEHSYHAETAPPFFACVAVPAFRTSRTRLRQMLVS
jgi:hypothetical protein